jgi:ketosteroid isomerase-like protein
MNPLSVRHPSLFGIGIRPLLAVLAALALSVPRLSASAPVATAPETEAAFKSFVAAWENADLAAASGVFTDDAVVFDPAPGGVFATPAAIKGWIADTFKAMEHIKIPYSDMKIRTSGAVAWLTGHYIFKAMVDGKPFADEGNITLVWVKQSSGAYKLASFHASPPPPAGPPPPPAK